MSLAGRALPEIFVSIHICHLSQPALSTRYCRVAPPTLSPPENYIIGQHATGSYCHAISRRGGGGAGRFHTRSKRPATPRGNA